MCVKTNHGYCEVAELISQNECATAIQEPLEVLKTWNSPEFFMCDYSEAEIAAIETSFPGIHLRLSQRTGLGKIGQETTNMVSPLQMQMFSLIFFEHVRGLHLQLPMRMA